MNRSHTFLLFTLLLALCPDAAGDEGSDIEFFERRIRPVLIRHCYECHSAASAPLKGGLRLDSRDFIRKGGESGPAVVPGNTNQSLLLEAIRHESFEMPPETKLSDKVIADFTKWIELGAPDPRDRPPSASEVADLSWNTVLEERRHWWSLQPVNSPEPPAANVEHPIDAFVSTKQIAAGITPGKPATGRVLARRLSLVLTGLPLTSGEVDRFAKDYEKDPDAAYETLVDRLLGSPHFGEHWARHWMDVVRFAETHGYEWNHEIRDAWRYRDYLIRAFNNDLPFDQLVREHIAGDLLESPRLNDQLGINESIIGTAFWRFGELGHDNCVDFPEIRFDALDDQIDTFGKAFQALTISCARCHDHKLDAISSKDYYALVGVLESCSQVVHTIDTPERISDILVQTQQIKRELRAELGKTWITAVDESHDTLVSAITAKDEHPTHLKKYVADGDLDYADPGYVLFRLVRREAGTGSQSTAETADLRRANWLWYPEGNAAVDAPIASRYFRRRIEIPQGRRVTKAVCFFAGDDRVEFFVNGDLVGTGNGHLNLVGIDITSKLMGGSNELAAINTNSKAPVKKNPGGWISVIRIEFEGGDSLLFHSDSNWKSSLTAKGKWRTDDFDGWVNARELGKAGADPWGFPWPNRVQVRREVPLASLWQSLKAEYLAEHNRRASSNAEHFDVWADFRRANRSDWSASGLGLSNGPSPAGEFTLTHEGDQVVAAILPAGFYTNVTSDRLNGSLRSPWVPAKKKFISVQLVGDGQSMVRPVVDSCGLNEFAGGGLQYLTGGAITWKRLPTSAGDSHRSFIELTTKSDNPRWPDRPGRAGTDDPEELQSPRSSFGLIRAVLHDSPTEPLPDLQPILALFKHPQPFDEAAIAAVFQTVARDAIIAWKNDCASDADVHWINWLLKAGVIPNSASGNQKLEELLNEYRTVISSIPAPRVIAGLADHGSGRNSPVLHGGDPSKPGPVVPRRYLEVMTGASQPVSRVGTSFDQGDGAERHPAESPGGLRGEFGPTGSGRRQLAELIASPSNPLTARVMVNRVWHHLFGRGIVATPDDFGRMGEKPTHPELLDFLAAGFVEDEWSIKRLIRRIVLSRTFRQTSLPNDHAVTIDPANELLHHYPARRLSAEAIRDTLLAVSGRLDATLYGPSIHPYRKREIDYRKLFSGPLDGAGRRSVYIKVTRMEGPQFLELFDFPAPMATRGRRDQTNVPAQALALLNDPFVIEQAGFWAEQLAAAKHETVEERIEAMFQRALGRSTTLKERQRFVSLIRRLAESPSADDDAIMQDMSIWHDAAHAIFNMQELIYIR